MWYIGVSPSSFESTDPMTKSAVPRWKARAYSKLLHCTSLCAIQKFLQQKAVKSPALYELSPYQSRQRVWEYIKICQRLMTSALESIQEHWNVWLWIKQKCILENEKEVFAQHCGRLVLNAVQMPQWTGWTKAWTLVSLLLNVLVYVKLFGVQRASWNVNTSLSIFQSKQALLENSQIGRLSKKLLNCYIVKHFMLQQIGPLRCLTVFGHIWGQMCLVT